LFFQKLRLDRRRVGLQKRWLPFYDGLLFFFFLFLRILRGCLGDSRRIKLGAQIHHQPLLFIGLYAHQHFTVDGAPLDAPKYAAYLTSVLPRPEDIAVVHGIEKEPDWIEPKKADSLG